MKGEEVFLKHLTWPEIARGIEAGYRRVIIVLGATEQHGPHLAEATDEVIGMGLAGGLARRLGKTYVAPPVVPGLSDHHLKLPGTLSLRPETMKMILEDYVSGYRSHGFDRFVFLPSHGGNMAFSAEMAQAFQKRYPSDRFTSPFDLKTMIQLMAKFEADHRLPRGSCGGHACAFETSLMLYLAPEMVRMDRAEPGYTGVPDEAFVKKMFQEGITGVSPAGVIGDPTRATEALGEIFFNETLEVIHRAVTALE